MKSLKTQIEPINDKIKNGICNSKFISLNIKIIGRKCPFKLVREYLQENQLLRGGGEITPSLFPA